MATKRTSQQVLAELGEAIDAHDAHPGPGPALDRLVRAIGDHQQSVKPSALRRSRAAVVSKKQPSAAPRVTFKHRAILEFKGVSYRYDKPHGVFSLIEPKNAEYFVPKTIYGWRDGTEWEVNSTRAESPLAALEKWFAGLIELRTREAAEAKQKAKEAEAEAKRLKTASWRARGV